MTNKIRVLSDLDINQIAAGEVVENAASVVKELVENAIDAGSTEIKIQVKAAGRQLISVTDNGSGMSRDDALLSLERHATSKIRSASDLTGVRTMGFRGEAVPSIAAVSKMKILTSPDGERGTAIEIEGGKIRKCGETARVQGTTIEVRQLFYNVPVRKGFQKTVGHEMGEINRAMTLIAMAHPEIQFELFNGNQSVLKTGQQEGMGQRVENLMGEEVFKTMKEVEHKDGPVAVKGFISDPTFSRPTRKGQYLFINGRAITSRFVSDVVREAYSTRLPTGRHPVYVLHLDLPGNYIDVNVHPQKREVRLRQENLIQGILERAIIRALQGEIPKVELSKVEVPLIQETAQPEVVYTLDWPPREESVVREPPAPPPVYEEPEIVQAPIHVMGMIDRYILIDGAQAGERLGKEGLVLVDSTAAFARVVYERMLEQLQGSRQSSQLLLVPITLELLPAEAKLLEGQAEMLSQLGLGVRPFGGQTFVVDALPAMIDSANVERLVTDLVGFLKEASGAGLVEKEREKTIALAACRAAAKGKRIGNTIEAMNLIQELLRCEVKEQCPQGKPTLVSLSMEEIAKKFR